MHRRAYVAVVYRWFPKHFPILCIRGTLGVRSKSEAGMPGVYDCLYGRASAIVPWESLCFRLSSSLPYATSILRKPVS